MKHLSTFILSLTLILFIGCSDETAKNNYTINFEGSKIVLPNIFQNTTIERLEFLVKNSNVQQSILSEYLVRFKYLKENSQLSELYLDSTNYSNSILIQKSEYVYLTKSISTQYISMIEKELNSQWERYNIEYERIKTSFSSNQLTQIVKIKYKLIKPESVTHFSQYVISNKGKTIAITFSTKDNRDFDGLISQIKM